MKFFQNVIPDKLQTVSKIHDHWSVFTLTATFENEIFSETWEKDGFLVIFCLFLPPNFCKRVQIN